MTDLIARLRGRSQFCKDRGEVKSPDLMNEAADRIEQTEAKLTKAVEALDMLVRDCEADYPPSHGAIKHFAIATLAEIKGESQDGMV